MKQKIEVQSNTHPEQKIIFNIWEDDGKLKKFEVEYFPNANEVEKNPELNKYYDEIIQQFKIEKSNPKKIILIF